MFERLLHIRQVMSGESKDDPVAMLNQGLPESYQHGIAICFDPSGTYLGVQLTRGNRGVIYRAGPPNGFDPTAVSKYPGKAENVVRRLLRSLKALEASDACGAIAGQIEAIIEDYDITKISQEVADHIAELDTKEFYPFVYVAWLDANGIRPLYSYPAVQDFMVSYALAGYGAVKGVDLTAENRSCSICGRPAEKIVGNFSLIACYNLDKRGVITGGMDYPSAPHNFPVCDSCMLGVSKAWDFVNTHLAFPLAGERYLLLPHVKDSELREFVVKLLRDREKGTSLRKKALETITNSEDEILEALADVSGDRDAISLSMVFFESSQAAWRITGEVHEILPSRIHRIYRTKRRIESDPVLTFKKDKPYHFTLKTLKTFTGSRPDKQSRKQFLAYVDAIFSGGHVAREVFFRDTVSTILNGFKREPDFASFMVRDAWASYCFLYELGVLPSLKGGVQMTQEDNAYGRFMAEHQDFFDRPEKKVAFLTGCYVDTVCYIQRKPEHLGNDPFFRKVRGLKMDRKRLQRIYPEARDKLHQYDSLGLVVTTLDPQLAQAWIDCGDRWELSDDEATFAFTLGLSLAWRVRGAKEGDASTDADAEAQAA